MSFLVFFLGADGRAETKLKPGSSGADPDDGDLEGWRTRTERDLRVPDEGCGDREFSFAFPEDLGGERADKGGKNRTRSRSVGVFTCRRRLEGPRSDWIEECNEHGERMGVVQH